MKNLIALITSLVTGKSRAPETSEPREPDVDTALRRILREQNRFREYTIDYLMDRLGGYPVELRRAILNATDCHKYIFLWVKYGWPASILNEYLTYRQELGVLEPDAILAGLHHYQQLPQMDDYTTADAKTQEQVRAILTVTRQATRNEIDRIPAKDNTAQYFGRFNHDGVKLKDDALIKLIMDYPQHADTIADLIRERGSADAGLIHDMITSGSSPLGSGTL
jgi:hypothetical protein